MKTKFISINAGISDFSESELAGLKAAGEILKSGGLVAFPTETVYGLGGDALNPMSAKRIYEAKGRPSDNPLIVHICEFDALYKIADNVPEAAKRLAEAFWAGPLTMIFQKKDSVPRETTGGLDTVAVRMPAHPAALKLIEYAGGYVAAPSANLSGKPSPTEARFVMEDMDGRIDACIDGGAGRIGIESTILDMTVRPFEILRPGYITKAQIEKALGEKVAVDEASVGNISDKAPRAPGMKYRHYAPKAELYIIEALGDDPKKRVLQYINERAGRDKESGLRVGVMSTGAEEYAADSVKYLGADGDMEEIAANLFRALREFDDEGMDVIYSESFEPEGVGAAVMNRLIKAAGYRIIRI